MLLLCNNIIYTTNFYYILCLQGNEVSVEFLYFLSIVYFCDHMMPLSSIHSLPTIYFNHLILTILCKILVAIATKRKFSNNLPVTNHRGDWVS